MRAFLIHHMIRTNRQTGSTGGHGLWLTRAMESPPKHNETDLLNRTVLVVGAASGVGRATAELFLSAGARVILAARRPERCSDLEALSPAGQVTLLPLDLTEDRKSTRLNPSH